MSSFLVLCAFSSFGNATDVKDVIQKIETRYKDVTSLQANFIQITNNPALQTPIEQNGQLSMMRPHNLRWDFEGAQSYIHNGETIWMWNPMMNQVIITKSKGQKDQITSLLTDLSKLEDKYTISLKEETTEAFHLQIKPKTDDQPFDSLQLYVSKTDYVLNKLSYAGENTGTVEISFSDVKLNQELKSEMFNFTPPKDAEVIDINE